MRPPLVDGVCALPRDVPDFTGRHAELDLLAGACRPGTVTLLHGPPGVGKTAVAVRAANRFGKRACFVTCRGRDADGIRDALRRATPRRAGTPCRLLVLDDVTAEEQIAPLPRTIPAVVTSRLPLADLPGIQRVRLEPLPPDDAVAMLAAITGAGVDDPDTRRVAGFCGHLPLALRAAGNRLATRPGWTMADLAARLADEDRRLANLTAGDLSVERVYAAAHAGMPDVFPDFGEMARLYSRRWR